MRGYVIGICNGMHNRISLFSLHTIKMNNTHRTRTRIVIEDDNDRQKEYDKVYQADLDIINDRPQARQRKKEEKKAKEAKEAKV